MTSSSRRSGFRLPWGDESAVTDAPPAEADGAPNDASAARTGASPDQFLGSLTNAMRGVVDGARQESLQQSKTAVEERIAAMRAAAADREADLRTRTEADVIAYQEWSAAEADRIRVETERKIEQRRQKLEEQLAEQQAKIASDVAALEARLTQHEQALDKFFANLTGITDPAAFIAAARSMPTMSMEVDAPASASAAAAEPTAETKAPPPPPTPLAEGDLEARMRELGLEQASDAGGTDAELTADSAPAETARTATRAKPAPSEAPAKAQPAGSIATDVSAQGLASFGAVTALKQSLAKMDGVESVTLSLGPTGEFVYRLNHASSFDVAAALRQAQPNGTVSRESDGTYRLEVPSA